MEKFTDRTIEERLRCTTEDGCDPALIYEAADEIERLRQVARNVYEIWGSEGIPMPETAAEAYLLRLVEQMRDEAKKVLQNAAAEGGTM